MKKKFFAYMIIGILLFTFLAQGKGTKTYWFQIASQGEGESGFLTNSNLNQKKVYLTFDDGPSDHTAQILDILKKYKVKATFFVVGKHVKWYPDSVIRASKEGHEIGNHTFTHPDISTLSNEQLKTEIKNCEDIIIEKTGKKHFSRVQLSSRQTSHAEKIILSEI